MITAPDGTQYSVLDLRAMYASRASVLPPLRARAIEMLLYRDMREPDAAAAVGLPSGTLIAACADEGLEQLLAAWEGGGAGADAVRGLQGA
jgi:hypothetical protein